MDHDLNELRLDIQALVNKYKLLSLDEETALQFCASLKRILDIFVSKYPIFRFELNPDMFTMAKIWVYM